MTHVVLAGFNTTGIARNERSRRHPDRDRKREIPGRDNDTHTERDVVQFVIFVRDPDGAVRRPASRIISLP